MHVFMHVCMHVCMFVYECTVCVCCLSLCVCCVCVVCVFVCVGGWMSVLVCDCVQPPCDVSLVMLMHMLQVY